MLCCSRIPHPALSARTWLLLLLNIDLTALAHRSSEV